MSNFARHPLPRIVPDCDAHGAPLRNIEDCDLYPPGHEAKVRHGTHCECVALATAMGLPPGAISFDYCKNVLQRRWSMTCKHGEVEETTGQSSAYEKWKHKGEMNPILAILIENA